MKKTIAIWVIAACAVLLFPMALAAENREEVREAYRAVGELPEESPYARQPMTTAPHDPGALTDEATGDALVYLNFLRALAGLDAVEENRLYDSRCQHGAVLLAALDYADHNAPCPEDMNRDFYESAHLGTASSNLAKFNWMRPSVLREGLAYFVRDDGDANLPVLGHRRWLLNPTMAETGFGLANSRTGMSYVVMYAHDFGNAGAQWETVKWPAEGAFPAELMHGDLAWSVSLNPEIYDAEHSEIEVTLTEENSGMTFSFDCTQQSGDGFCTVSMENYGGPCLIFRPDFEGTDFTDYQQNQRWTVKIVGLSRMDGAMAALEYTVEMISLYVQEVANIEMSRLDASMQPGETLTLTANVVPAYADDLSVLWSSSDETVATVDEAGLVTAIGTGICEIRAESANGRYDACEITVGTSDGSPW